MRRLRVGKLGTRITRRMVTLFAVCAVLPVAAAIFVAYEQVHEALVAQRHAQLREIAAGYGSALIDRLNAAGIPTTLRDTRGKEIDGACGQLAAVEVDGA